MPRAFAVIGAGYGDEGKGLVTDYLCSKHGARVVVRFNGGAQAGHTVVTPLGERHVFHHFGSGTYAGADTFLNRHFICNPILFCSELDELGSIAEGSVLVDGRCSVTTPYDMLINQLVERQRGGVRHGSCGVGIYETLHRKKAGYDLRVSNLHDKDYFISVLDMIADSYTRQRLRELGLPDDSLDEFILNGQMKNDFMHAVHRFILNTTLAVPEMLRGYRDIVFEGAQGLAIGQENMDDFPYLTPSYTGLKNVMQLCAEIGIDELHPYYVTRCYSTRHGAGPLPGETESQIYKSIVDSTNMPGEFQGSLRFAPLDIDALSIRISRDVTSPCELGKTNICNPPTIAITCIDHVDDHILHRSGGLPVQTPISQDAVPSFISERIGFYHDLLWSNGPTRAHVQQGDGYVQKKAGEPRVVQG